MTPHPRRRTLLLSAATASGLTMLPCGRALAEAVATPPKLDVPYVPTPQEVVDEMLELGKVGKNDTLFDLGCGDGRIVVTVAKVRGARGTGIDIDPVRIAEATENARKAGVSDRAKFRVGDLFKTDISSATVVTLYLLPTINARLRPQLWKQLKVGTRVVSHEFDMGAEWPAAKTAEVDGRTIYYWTITEANKRQATAAV
jgi:SAM-dependent methyltransferase